MSVDLDQTDQYGNRTSVKGGDQFMEDLTNLMKMPRKDRSTIIEAGAPVAERKFTEAAPFRFHAHKSQDYLGGKKRRPLHIKEGVTHKPNQYMDGSTDIGFNSSTAPIARWVNDGTRFQPPQFFFDHAINNLDTNELFGLENQEFEKLIQWKYPELHIRFD